MVFITFLEAAGGLEAGFGGGIFFGILMLQPARSAKICMKDGKLSSPKL